MTRFVIGPDVAVRTEAVRTSPRLARDPPVVQTSGFGLARRRKRVFWARNHASFT